MPTSDTRQRLLGAAVETLHRDGFGRASLGRIADRARVPAGNVYYWFRTKEALAAAVIDEHGAAAEALREQWASLPGPRERLVAFVDMTVGQRAELARSGCPVGTLGVELAKQRGGLCAQVDQVFDAWREWLATQFAGLAAAEPQRCAVHLLSALQGAALLAAVSGRPETVQTEAETLRRWIGEL